MTGEIMKTVLGKLNHRMLNENWKILLFMDNAGCHPDNPVGNTFKHQDLLPSTKHHFSIATSGLGDHKELQAPLSPVFLEVHYFEDG